jgi:acylphosphatase
LCRRVSFVDRLQRSSAAGFSEHCKCCGRYDGLEQCEACCCNLISIMSRAKRYIVRGRVQGVGYRYFAQGVAERLGVAGFVRNLPSGDVEVIGQADTGILELFKQELERGPRMSRVTEIIESDVEPSGLHSSFQIRG